MTTKHMDVCHKGCTERHDFCAVPSCSIVSRVDGTVVAHIEGISSDEVEEADMDFIAHSRADIPFLLETIDALEAKIKRLEKE